MMKKYLFVLAILLLIQHLDCFGRNIFFSTINDSVISHTSFYRTGNYSNGKGASVTNQNSDVEKGAIIGGIAGLIAGTVAGGIVNPDNSLLQTIGDIIREGDASGSINQDQVPFIVGGTLAGVAIGALIGARYNKTVINNKEITIEFQPALAKSPGKNNEILCSLKVNIK